MAKQTRKKDENIDNTNETSNVDSNRMVIMIMSTVIHADGVESELRNELNEGLNGDWDDVDEDGDGFGITDGGDA